MKENDRPEFAKLMGVLSELYRKPLSKALIDLYWMTLERFDILAIAQAINVHIQNPDKGAFMPLPADMILYLDGSASTQGMRAWTKVMDAIKQAGVYQTVTFDDPLIHVVITDMGGWIKLCGMKESDIPFRAREFEKRYCSYLINKPTQIPKKLIGIIDAENMSRGFQLENSLFLDNESSAKNAYLEGDIL